MQGLPEEMLLAISGQLDSPADFANFGAVDRRTHAVLAASGQPAEHEAAFVRRLCRDLVLCLSGERMMQLTNRAVAFLVRPAATGGEHDEAVCDAMVAALQCPVDTLLICDIRQTAQLARLLLRLLDATHIPDTVLDGYMRTFLKELHARCLNHLAISSRFTSCPGPRDGMPR